MIEPEPTGALGGTTVGMAKLCLMKDPPDVEAALKHIDRYFEKMEKIFPHYDLAAENRALNAAVERLRKERLKGRTLRGRETND